MRLTAVVENINNALAFLDWELLIATGIRE